MRANTIIASTTKIAVIAKDLIARWVTMFLEPRVKAGTKSLRCPFYFRASVDMVNGQKLGVRFSATNTFESAISFKYFKPNLSSIILHVRHIFIMMRLIIVLAISLSGFIMRKIISMNTHKVFRSVPDVGFSAASLTPILQSVFLRPVRCKTI